MHSPVRKYTDKDLAQLEELIQARARENFAFYRRYIRPDMVWGWWTEEVATHFQQFYEDLVAGRRPKLALMTPPQHGKSWTVEDFVAWLAGKNPELRTIFGSYSDDLGVRCNLNTQRTIQSDRYQSVFWKTRVGDAGWQCNTELIEYCGHRGSFRNVTVLGGINGMGLDLGIIDDPVKGRAEAMSKVARDRVWNWFTDDFMYRFSNLAGLIVVMTRWHVDDLLGRAFNRLGDFRILKYPAIAEIRNGVRNWSDRRQEGEPLFPELKPLDFLVERRKLQSDASWESEAQQSPYIVGGGQLPIEKLKVVPFLDRSKIIHSIRYWDKAGTDDGGAYTSGVLMHSLVDKTFLIESVVRGQWSALQREQRIRAMAEADAAVCKSYQVWVEQEPGSGGKESAEATIRNLAGFRVQADKVTGSKEVRAEPFAAQVQGGNVFLVAGAWVLPFLEECESWPNGRFKDQVDSAAGALTKLAALGTYNTNYEQWAV